VDDESALFAPAFGIVGAISSIDRGDGADEVPDRKRAKNKLEQP